MPATLNALVTFPGYAIRWRVAAIYSMVAARLTCVRLVSVDGRHQMHARMADVSVLAR